MTAGIAFSVHGTARGKGRPRATVRAGHAKTYTDPKTRAYEAKVKKEAVKAVAGAAPLLGPIQVALQVRLAIPPSFSRKRRERILSGIEPYYGPFDVDNVAKSILDGCNKVCFEDDKQVMQLLVIKRAAERPGVDIRIRHFEGAEA